MKQIPVHKSKVGYGMIVNWPFQTREWRDEKAITMIRLAFPQLLTEMPSKLSAQPEYDDRENICYQWLGDNQGCFLIGYIAGNSNPELNGWIVREFRGVVLNSEKWLSLFDWMRRSHGGLVLEERD